MATELATRATPASDDAYGDNEFRVSHGRYGSLWYRDALPACAIAEPDTDDRVSVSIVKKASGSDWSNVTIKRIASALEENPGRFAGLNAYEIGQEMRRINTEGLRGAATRGTNVHTIAEQLLQGVPVTITADMPGGEYRDAVEAFFEQYDPTPVLMEFVCFNRALNGHGFGGTCDAIIEIKGKRYAVDWKSRGEDSRHGCYSQEAAQVGGYSLAEYIVVERQRQALPTLDGALIVSIKPDGFAVYPLDLPKSQQHFVDLHAWWVARQDEGDTYGRMWPKSRKAKIAAPSEPTGAGTPSEVEQRVTQGQLAPDPGFTLATSITEWSMELRKLLADIWPADLPSPGKIRKGEATWDLGQLMRAQAAVDEIVGSWVDADRTQPIATQEGTQQDIADIDREPVADPASLDVLLATIKASPCLALVNGWLHEAHEAGRSFSPRKYPTLRNYEISRAAFWLASIIADAPDDATDATFDELVRGLLARVMATELPQMPANPVGVMLSHLSILEASTISNAAQGLVEGRSMLVFTDQGAPVLVDA